MTISLLLMTAALIFGAGILAIIAIDIVILAKSKNFNDTISWHLYLASLQYPIIPFAFGIGIGVLAGHLYWNQTLNITVCPGLTSQ
jgi:hypothetical protein